MSPEKVFYLTKDGLKKVGEEYKKLKELRRVRLGKQAPSALYSEELNAEFVSFKEELDYLDSRIEELEYILKNFEIIKPPSFKERNRVCLGASVAVEIDGQTDEFLIVGTLEANPSLGRISNESPVGKALLGCKVGDEVVINSPIRVVYKIKKIKYRNLP